MKCQFCDSQSHFKVTFRFPMQTEITHMNLCMHDPGPKIELDLCVQCCSLKPEEISSKLARLKEQPK